MGVVAGAAAATVAWLASASSASELAAISNGTVAIVVAGGSASTDASVTAQRSVVEPRTEAARGLEPQRRTPLTPTHACEAAREDLLRLVDKARRGEISQQGLRLARRAIEARLEIAVARLAIDLRPGEFAELGEARSRLNQAIIRSQEWEVFGPTDRPEWGWYPSRDIRSTDGTVAFGAGGIPAGSAE